MKFEFDSDDDLDDRMYKTALNEGRFNQKMFEGMHEADDGLGPFKSRKSQKDAGDDMTRPIAKKKTFMDDEGGAPANRKSQHTGGSYPPVGPSQEQVQKKAMIQDPPHGGKGGSKGGGKVGKGGNANDPFNKGKQQGPYGSKKRRTSQELAGMVAGGDMSPEDDGGAGGHDMGGARRAGGGRGKKAPQEQEEYMRQQKAREREHNKHLQEDNMVYKKKRLSDADFSGMNPYMGLVRGGGGNYDEQAKASSHKFHDFGANEQGRIGGEAGRSYGVDRHHDNVEEEIKIFKHEAMVWEEKL